MESNIEKCRKCQSGKTRAGTCMTCGGSGYVTVIRGDKNAVVSIMPLAKSDRVRR